MFFAPTLLALTRPELGNHVKILCLSSGNAAGLGSIREKELHKSALHLGLRDESDVFVVDDPTNFPDSMTTDWSATSIASLLASAFAPTISCESNATSTASSPTTATHRKPHSNGNARSNNEDDTTPPTATIDVLLTFDPSGISNHPNHRSLHHGARAFLSSLMKGKSGYACPVTLYTLTTTNIVRKYLGALDAPVSMIVGIVQGLLYGKKEKDDTAVTSASNDTSIRVQESAPRQARRLLFISGIPEWLKAQQAMVAGHKSQMVWFRWGWITIGRYMVVNDLKREVV
ncbi:N-acetylglucosaminyl-phosphatidylinositol de-N-acetylase [Arachnomyces sp. PD_36]|nr:N-acetylglucosaminyl-phosphatidylinositol de-N-acetylase [Arachnomyces sp. PD_36]